MCQSVHNYSNASSKRHDKLTVMDTSQQMFKVFPLALTRALRRFRHLISDALLDPNHAKIVSSDRMSLSLDGCLCV